MLVENVTHSVAARDFHGGYIDHTAVMACVSLLFTPILLHCNNYYFGFGVGMMVGIRVFVET